MAAQLVRTPSPRGIAAAGVIGGVLSGLGLFLFVGAGAAKANADAYEAASVCAMPEPVSLSSCVAEVPATVSDAETQSSRNSTTYNVEVRYGNGTTQWADAVDNDFYDAVDIGSRVSVGLWKGGIAYVDDGHGHGSAASDHPTRQAQNGLFIALAVLGGGLFTLGYAQLALARRHQQPVGPPPSSAVPLPDLASWLRLAAMCVYVGVAIYLLIVGLGSLDLPAVIGLVCLVVSVGLAVLLRASMRLSLGGDGLALRGWGVRTGTIAYSDIRQVRRGRTMSWKAGAKALPLFRLRFATARNDPFIRELQRRLPE